MVVITTEFIPLSLLYIVSTGGKAATGLEKKYCAQYWSKELLESLDWCTGRHHITEITLKMAFNTIQSISKSYSIPENLGPYLQTILKNILQLCYRPARVAQL